MNIEYYTDGACSSADNSGGLAFVKVVNNKIICQFSVGEKNTTNNRMEIKSILASLEDICKKHIKSEDFISIKIISDSKYCVDSINIWLKRWEENNFFRNDSKKNVKNIDLWERFCFLRDYIKRNSGIQIEYMWVKGHNENIFNNTADRLAVEARIKISKEGVKNGV